eukprot:2994432-Alexandrium_andersonii.AAC.1
MTTFELMSVLQGEGWECRVLPRKQGRAEGFELPVPYIHGSAPKLWWVKPSSGSVSHPYLLALLLAQRQELPPSAVAVEHFMTNKWYMCLMDGSELPTKRTRFAIMAASEAGKPRRQQKRRPAAKKRPRLAIVGPAASASASGAAELSGDGCGSGG